MSKIKKWFDKTNKFDLIGYIVLFVFMACILSYCFISVITLFIISSKRNGMRLSLTSQVSL